MKFNHILLDTDIRKKQFKEDKYENAICKEIGISRTTRYRIKIGKPITMDVFLKCLEWLNREPWIYFKDTSKRSNK